MQGAMQPWYEPGGVTARVSGLLMVSLGAAAHRTMVRRPNPPLVSTNATCEPSLERTGEVRIWPPVLYAQYMDGTGPKPLHPEYMLS